MPRNSGVVTPIYIVANGNERLQVIGVYLDWKGHSPCNEVYVFAMLNVRLQNHANYATMVTYCGAACIGECILNCMHVVTIFLTNAITPQCLDVDLLIIGSRASLSV